MKGTKFGGLLDMLTDRLATAGLLCVLCFFYSNWILLWQMLIILDISSHWILVQTSVLRGDTTHKNTDHPLMKFYYGYKV